MTTHVLQFAELSDSDRKKIGRLGKLAKGDRIEVRVKRRGGADQTLSLPPDAAALIEALLVDLCHHAPDLILASLANARRNLSKTCVSASDFINILKNQGLIQLSARIARHLTAL